MSSSDTTTTGKEKTKSDSVIDVVVPQQGILYSEDVPDYILCKPKLMPLKSVTLEKLEKMQKDAEAKLNEVMMQNSENVTSNNSGGEH
ncbi:BBSome-interacting protein 1 [Copidosoma floridanum]|uniref:BBSome-interacting protein 1 n=1 Tax=Copidosoma floridanum TaxID=29053 RepID=UPI0006C9D7E2|nr:BBSome-interacting protein 1 [Copidosoma floridanum]